jgi:hypothetical protein
MKRRFPKTITRWSLLLVTARSCRGVHVTSQEHREGRPAVVRGGGGLRRKSMSTTHASESSERLLANNDDEVYSNNAADDSASGGTTGGLDGYVSMVQDWETTAISKFHDFETSANSTAWEFYTSPPSEWTQHQWDLVVDLLLGLFSICFLGTMCCIHFCCARDHAENEAPFSTRTSPTPLSPKPAALPAASPHKKAGTSFWSAWTPTTPSSFFPRSPSSFSFYPGCSSSTASHDRSRKRSSRRHHRGGGRDRRRRLIDSDDETEKYRGRRTDYNESTDDDCTVDSRSEQSWSTYEPPSVGTINSVITSYDRSQVEMIEFSKTKSGSNNLDVGKSAYDDKNKGTPRKMTVKEIVVHSPISANHKDDAVGVGTLASTKNQGGSTSKDRNLSKMKSGGNNLDVGKSANNDKNKGTPQKMTMKEIAIRTPISANHKDDAVGVGTLASTKNQGENVFLVDSTEDYNKEVGIQQEKLANEIPGPAPTISLDQVGVGALGSTKNEGMNVFIFDNKEENIDREESAEDIAIPAAKISEDRDWKKKFQEWKNRKDDAAGDGTSTHRKNLLPPDYSGDRKSNIPPSLNLKRHGSIGVGLRMINDNPVLASYIEKARSPDSGVWRNEKPPSPHVDGRERHTYEIKGGTKTGPEIQDTDALAKNDTGKGTQQEKMAGEVDGGSRGTDKVGVGAKKQRGVRQISSDTDVVEKGAKVGGVEELDRNYDILSSSKRQDVDKGVKDNKGKGTQREKSVGEITKRRRKKRTELV